MKLDLLIVKTVDLNGYCGNDTLCIEGSNYFFSSLLWLTIIVTALYLGSSLEQHGKKQG